MDPKTSQSSEPPQLSHLANIPHQGINTGGGNFICGNNTDNHSNQNNTNNSNQNNNHSNQNNNNSNQNNNHSNQNNTTNSNNNNGSSESSIDRSDELKENKADSVETDEKEGRVEIVLECGFGFDSNVFDERKYFEALSSYIDYCKQCKQSKSSDSTHSSNNDDNSSSNRNSDNNDNNKENRSQNTPMTFSKEQNQFMNLLYALNLLNNTQNCSSMTSCPKDPIKEINEQKRGYYNTRFDKIMLGLNGMNTMDPNKISFDLGRLQTMPFTQITSYHPNYPSSPSYPYYPNNNRHNNASNCNFNGYNNNNSNNNNNNSNESVIRTMSDQIFRESGHVYKHFVFEVKVREFIREGLKEFKNSAVGNSSDDPVDTFFAGMGESSFINLNQIITQLNQQGGQWTSHQIFEIIQAKLHLMIFVPHCPNTPITLNRVSNGSIGKYQDYLTYIVLDCKINLLLLYSKVYYLYHILYTQDHLPIQFLMRINYILIEEINQNISNTIYFALERFDWSRIVGCNSQYFEFERKRFDRSCTCRNVAVSSEQIDKETDAFVEKYYYQDGFEFKSKTRAKLTEQYFSQDKEKLNEMLNILHMCLNPGDTLHEFMYELEHRLNVRASVPKVIETLIDTKCLMVIREKYNKNGNNNNTNSNGNNSTNNSNNNSNNSNNSRKNDKTKWQIFKLRATFDSIINVAVNMKKQRAFASWNDVLTEAFTQFIYKAPLGFDITNYCFDEYIYSMCGLNLELLTSKMLRNEDMTQRGSNNNAFVQNVLWQNYSPVPAFPNIL